MMKKLGIILLSIAFLLSAFSLLPVKKAVCHTEDRPMLMAAEPWSNDFYQSGNPSPPDTSGLSTFGNRVKMQANHQNSVPNRPHSRDRNLFHRLLHTLWGMIFPEHF